jgi:hypothetical protein
MLTEFDLQVSITGQVANIQVTQGGSVQAWTVPLATLQGAVNAIIQAILNAIPASS